MTYSDGYPPFYGPRRTPANVDIHQYIVVAVFCALAVGFLSILAGIRGRARVFWFTRVFLSLLIGCITLVVNFQTHWEVGHVETQTEYRVADGSTIKARIGLGVSLHGFNITLKGLPELQLNETIAYNEQFEWASGSINSDYHDALERGLPKPILQLAETFLSASTCANVYLYAQAGLYASAFLWVAFACWLLSNLFFLMVLTYGGAALLLTGFFQLVALAAFACTRLQPLCRAHLGLEGATLVTALGSSFWLTLGNAVLCLLLGSLVIGAHFLAPHTLEVFFSIEEETENPYESEKVPFGNNGYRNEAFTEGPSVERNVAVMIPEEFGSQQVNNIHSQCDVQVTATTNSLPTTTLP
ncbi:dual oxidase maturation factor 2-like [Lampetra fluviatilis]